MSALATPQGVEVTLDDGSLAVRAEGSTRVALLSRIDEALKAYRAGDAGDLGARLARSGRDRAAWLGALSDRRGDFRTAPLDDERLWHLVESPTAPPTARAAAALVLSRGAGAEDHRRLRIAADACAFPRLRVVLDKAGAGADEEALGEALDAVEDEDEQVRARARR